MKDNVNTSISATKNTSDMANQPMIETTLALSKVETNFLSLAVKRAQLSKKLSQIFPWISKL